MRERSRPIGDWLAVLLPLLRAQEQIDGRFIVSRRLSALGGGSAVSVVPTEFLALPARQTQWTAAGSLRRLRGDFVAKLSKLGQNLGLATDSAPSSGTTMFLVLSRHQASSSILASHDGQAEESNVPRLANRLVSSSTRLVRNEGLTRGRSDCRDLGPAFGDCGQRLSPPCVAWGTPSCRRNQRGMSLAVDQSMES